PGKAAIVEGLRIVRLEAECCVVVGQSPVIEPLAGTSLAAVDERPGLVGLAADGLVIVGDRLIEALLDQVGAGPVPVDPGGLDAVIAAGLEDPGAVFDPLRWNRLGLAAGRLRRRGLGRHHRAQTESDQGAAELESHCAMLPSRRGGWAGSITPGSP